MSRRRILQIIVSAASVLIVAGVVLMGVVMDTEDDRNVIHVDLDEGSVQGSGQGENGTTEQSIDFECLTLVPGESCEYTLNFDGEESDRYDVTVKLYENQVEKNHTLKNFVFLRIESGETTVCDMLLKDVYASEGFTLPVDQTTGENTELRFVYYLPIDVGNEAQNAEAFFGLKIIASNETE